MSADRRGASALAAVTAGALPLVLYLRTLAPTVYGVDGAELSTAAFLLGIAHPPGSPAYLLLGHVFTWLPVGDIGYRLNLLSAGAAALAMVFAFQILYRLTGQRMLAVLASWFLGATYYVWVTAVAAEIYAVQGCVTLALIALALRWRAGADARLFLLLCTLAGFGIGVHPAIGLLLPGLALLALGGPPRVWRQPRLLIGGIAMGLLGLSVYVYLPLRNAAILPLNPARDYWQIDLGTWQGFWWMVSGRVFAEYFFAVTPGGLPAELAVFAQRWWNSFLGVGVLLGVLGLGADWRRRPWLHAALGLMVLGHLAFFLPYGAGDKELMFTPVHLIWGLWVGLGASALAGFVADRTGVRTPMLACAILLSATTAAIAVNVRRLDLSADWSTRQRAAGILQELAPDAVYLGAWGDLRLVEYLQVVEGQRRDVLTVDVTFAPAGVRWRTLVAYAAGGRPVYVSTCEGLERTDLQCEYRASCACYRVHRVAAP